MREEEFYFLYTHANCLAELGLKASGIELEALLEDCDPDVLENELGAIPDSLDDLDFSAVEGLGMYDTPMATSESDQKAIQTSLDAIEAELKNMEKEGTKLEADNTVGDLEGASFDLATYLQKAYDQRAALGQHLAKAYQDADLVQLASRLQSLPANMPSLLGPMSAEDLQKWQEVYLADQPELMALVAEIRRLSQA